MRFLLSIYFSFLACIGLLGFLALRLARKIRRQQRELGELSLTLQRSREQAEEQKHRLDERSDLDHAKDEFISTVSHELRTPLTSIRGALGLLSSGLLGNVDARAQNLLRIASTNTERLIRLINDILDLERMESGRAPVNLRRCSIYDLAREAVDTMSALADAARIRLELNSYATHDLIYFDADPDRILQVLTNLLSNAIKFSPEGSTVSVQIDANADTLSLKVIDRGRGIPADKLESIFDRFQQVESSDSSKKGARGLAWPSAAASSSSTAAPYGHSRTRAGHIRTRAGRRRSKATRAPRSACSSRAARGLAIWPRPRTTHTWPNVARASSWYATTTPASARLSPNSFAATDTTSSNQAAAKR